MTVLPVALYGLEVPPQGIMVPAMQEDSVPGAAYRITMAALDPTEAPEADEDGNIPSVPRSTLKLIRKRPSLDDELDDEYLGQLMGDDSSDEDDDEDDDEDEPNGGPSDPSKSKRAKQDAALRRLLQAAQAEEDSDEEMGEDNAKPNGVAKTSKKGKEPATSSDDEDEDESIASSLDIEELVVCTLDTERNYQQPLDITIGPDEEVFFVVKGTHTIHLTGNYVIDTDEDASSDEEDEDEDYGMEGIDEYESDGSEIDELDDIQDPRITEIDTDEEEEAPKLVAAQTKKGKNKRLAEDEVEGLDDLIAKAGAAQEAKLSKKQQKKLKNNKGEPVGVKEDVKAGPAKDTPPKGDKKVQFAKNLEQGPTGSAAAEKGAALGVKVIQGVTVDDRKIGSGRAVKKGNKVEVRYIGKLQDGKVFDSNKKGKPFSFSAGKGEVIKGWDIGIQGMSVGGERRLTIPANLAYGSKSQPGIPGNSTLIFDIKLLAIK
ncbi:peptidylprolyl isomerase fpr3 [Parahypoxylon ruwenzoriense]